MADKEACVYILDQGLYMAEKNSGRKETNLDWALTYVWDSLTATIATERKTLLVGILGLGTEGTANPMGDEPGFRHISTLMEIQQPLLSHVERLQRDFTVNQSHSGDALSAIAIAIHLIIEKCKKLKYNRKIILVTSGQGPMYSDDVGQIISKINEYSIDLQVLGIDFDDLRYGFKEEGKAQEKAKNEATLLDLTNRCNGSFGSLAEAIKKIKLPQVKTPRSVATFKGLLTLGNPDVYNTAIKIGVERYMKTSVQRPQTASSWVAGSDEKSIQDSLQSSVTIGREDDSINLEKPSSSLLDRVRQIRDYQIPDVSKPGGQKVVERETLAKGFLYGRTVVPISESEENITRLETSPGIEIIGFIPQENFEPWFGMSTSYTILPMKGNHKAALAFSSLVRTLREYETYAVARFVEKADRPPTMRLLAPISRPKYECLIDVMLPFTEDLRPYQFPPLEKVMTVTGEKLTEHRNLPTRTLQSAMDALVENMALPDFAHDDDGEPRDYAGAKDAFSPHLHRINQAVRFRAIHPADPLPVPHSILSKYSIPPAEITKRAADDLDLVKIIADVKRVPPKAKGRRGKDETKPLSGLDIEGLLSGSRKSNISYENPIPEFKRLLDAADSVQAIRSAAKQMGEIISRRIKGSFADTEYARAAEELRILRQEMVLIEEPGIYNDFVRTLKGKLLKDQLGGERKEMWYSLRAQRLGLITHKETDLSDVDETAASTFLWGAQP